MSLTATTIMGRRLRQQRISGKRFSKPSEAVAWLGAAQAQDFHGAKWAIGLRMCEPNDGDIERAFEEGAILRTHLMRPTWHFVTPEDIRWLLELTAPRVHSANSYMYRQVGVDESLGSRSNRIIAKALEGGKHLTRAELGSTLTEAGIMAKGLRLVYIMMNAELYRVACSGPRRGKQFTYALFDERVPSAGSLTKKEALAALALRYFNGHGPATLRDFVWWSGLAQVDAKEGLETARSSLVKDVMDGETYWSSGGERAVGASAEAHLLPMFDELLIGYSSFDSSRRGGEGGRVNLAFRSPVLLGGRVIGTWRRSLSKGTATVEVAPFRPLETTEAEKIDAAVERYGRFLGTRMEWKPA